MSNDKILRLRNPKGKYVINIGRVNYASDIADPNAHLEAYVRDWMRRKRGKPGWFLPMITVYVNTKSCMLLTAPYLVRYADEGEHSNQWIPKDPRAVLPLLDPNVSVEEGGRWKEEIAWLETNGGQIEVFSRYNAVNRRIRLSPETARLWAKALEALAFEAELTAEQTDKTPL